MSPPLEIPPVVHPVGAAELIEEVSGGKITGEEDRYSHTDLWDFAANVEGSLSRPSSCSSRPSRPRTPTSPATIDDGFAEIERQLADVRGR